MKKTCLIGALCAVVLSLVALSSHAALIDRGGGLIYDDVLDVTWLQDAGLGGLRSRHNAKLWADGLMHGGFDDWRLPSINVNGDTMVVDCNEASELACQDNELGYMYYYNLPPFSGSAAGDHELIKGVQSRHWSDYQFPPSSSSAWVFQMASGDQFLDVSTNNHGAWAVRSGDVLAAPIPAAVWLFGSGLIGLAGIARKRKAT